MVTTCRVSCRWYAEQIHQKLEWSKENCELMGYHGDLMGYMIFAVYNITNHHCLGLSEHGVSQNLIIIFPIPTLGQAPSHEVIRASSPTSGPVPSGTRWQTQPPSSSIGSQQKSPPERFLQHLADFLGVNKKLIEPAICRRTNELVGVDVMLTNLS